MVATGVSRDARSKEVGSEGIKVRGRRLRGYNGGLSDKKVVDLRWRVDVR
jgi:hypothetical protein